MKYRLIAEWRPITKRDMYWIEYKSSFFSPWQMINGSCTFEKEYAETLFKNFAESRSKGTSLERIIKEVEV